MARAIYSGVLLALLLAAPAPAAPPLEDFQPPSAKDMLARLRPHHPRLLVEPGGFEKLKQRIQSDDRLRTLYEREVRKEADRLLDTPVVEYEIPDGKRLLGVSRELLRRVYTLALAYHIEGEKKYLDRAWDNLRAAARFKDWNQSHFLDVAEMTHGFAIGYDWLYHGLTAERRGVLRRAIVDKGLRFGLKAYTEDVRYDGWTTKHHNWNQVCNGGLTLGALAIADENPDLAGRILHQAIERIPLAMERYAPEGGYREGVIYWGYGTAYNVFYLAALESALGTDFGLSGAEGFSNTPLFPIHLTGPTGTIFNFADSGHGRAPEPRRTAIVHWFARRFPGHRPLYAAFANRHADPDERTQSDVHDVLWYTGSAGDPSDRDIPRDRYWPGVEAAAMRGSWADPNATWVAAKAGWPGVNHGHADAGSFVLEALGERWAVDLGSDDYNLPGYFGRKPGGPRWKYFRTRAEAHNTLVLNPDEGPGQIVSARTKITRFESNPENAYALMDLTPAYRDDARRVRRGLALLNRRDVLVQDEVRAKEDAPADLWWRLHTRATIDIGDGGRTATLHQNGKELGVRLLSPEGAKFLSRPVKPMPTSPDPSGQASHEGYRALTIHLPEARDTRIAVLLSPRSDEHDTEPPSLQPLDQW